MKNRTLLALLTISLLASACGAGDSAAGRGSNVESTVTTLDEVSTAVDALAEEVCRGAVWTGIENGTSFQGELDEGPIPGATERDLAAAVEGQCGDAFYQPLNGAELAWCGNGHDLSRNFFNVAEAGIELRLPSFSVVELPLLRKAKKIGAELSDYEIELFTAEIVSMTSTSGFARDWAVACRSTI